MTSKEQRQQAYRGCIVLFSIVGCLFLWISLVTFDPRDWPSANAYPHPAPAANGCGRAGAWVAYRLFFNFGEGAYPLAMGASLAALLLAWQGTIRHFWQRVLGVSLLVVVTAVSVYLVAGPSAAAMPEQRGGILGIALGYWMRQNFSLTGTILILAYCMFVGIAFTAEGLAARAPAALRHMGRASSQMLEAARQRMPFQLVPAGAGAGSDVAAPLPRSRRSDDRSAADKRASRTRGRTADNAADASASLFEEEDEDAATESKAAQSASGRTAVAEADEDSGDDDTLTELDTDDAGEIDDGDETADAEVADSDAEDDESQESEEAEEEAPPPPPPVKVVSRRLDPADALKVAAEHSPIPAAAYPKELGEWSFPSLSLLTDPEYLYTAQQETLVREKARTLERTLEEFRIEAHVVEIDTGPVITMFEIQIAAGVKVSQISALANDIARALKAPAVRVVAPIPGKNTVGIEVPNIDKEVVRIKELMALGGSKVKSMALPLFLGKDASGNPLIADLASMPHMLIAGTTGSGKSVCINTVIVSLLMTQRPDMVKLVLVDPKMVEMSQFKEVPHLMCPIITDMARAEKMLDWTATKMDERYELLAEAGVRNIVGYNQLTKEELYERFMAESDEEKAKIATHLPRIVIIIDELADLMMTAAKEVEMHLARLAQKSRAVGIHIIVATQRPEAKIVTGLIKSNLPCRVAFRVASRMDSRIVLDQNGAEVLMGQGDMLFLPPGSAKLVRAQGSYVSDAELRDVIHFLKQAGEPEFHPELVQLKTDDAVATGDRDPLFDEAVRIVLETKRGSVSLLQRRLTIGYARASRLVEQMADAGIVGSYKGSQAREVMMTLEEWEALRSQVARELTEGYEADQEDEPAEPE